MFVKKSTALLNIYQNLDAFLRFFPDFTRLLANWKGEW